MLRFSYEWIEDDGGEPDWTDQLYAIFDSKLGFGEHQAFAWAWDRGGAETIVNALNAADERERMAATVWQLAKRRDQYDLSDLLN